jgi:hypothetical protein
MSAAKLKPLLARGDLVSHRLEDASSLCDKWYEAEPSLTTFVLRSLLQDLIARGWDDAQGVPASHYKLFKDLVLPHLKRIVDILAVTPSAEPIGELDTLVVAYRNSFPPP